MGLILFIEAALSVVESAHPRVVGAITSTPTDCSGRLQRAPWAVLPMMRRLCLHETSWFISWDIPFGRTWKQTKQQSISRYDILHKRAAWCSCDHRSWRNWYAIRAPFFCHYLRLLMQPRHRRSRRQRLCACRLFKDCNHRHQPEDARSDQSCHIEHQSCRSNTGHGRRHFR